MAVGIGRHAAPYENSVAFYQVNSGSVSSRYIQRDEVAAALFLAQISILNPGRNPQVSLAYVLKGRIIIAHGIKSGAGWLVALRWQCASCELRV